ncbi:MAG: oxidoreductase [Candidatus Hydrogenedentes bacterium]|nr:oxidoreductase [Candidatus Hydrogenedentota bacterium]
MFDRNTYFVRERVAFLKLADTYDILDPETQAQIGIAQERPGGWVHALRFLVNKQLLPTKVFVYEGEDPADNNRLLFSIHRGPALFRSKITIQDRNGRVIGWFKSKLLSLGGAFRVFDADGNEAALVKGDWKGWNFQFLDNTGNELGRVTKKWAGVGKELFTSADNYIITLNGESSPAKAVLLLAAGLAVDTVYKERR